MKIHEAMPTVQPPPAEPQQREGFYPLPHAFLGSPVWSMPPLAMKLYVYLHLIAAYGDDGYTLPSGLHLCEGQAWTTWKRLQGQLHARRGRGFQPLPIRTLRDSMDQLIAAGLAAVKGARSGMVITLCDYVTCEGLKAKRRTIRRTISRTHHIEAGDRETPPPSSRGGGTALAERETPAGKKREQEQEPEPALAPEQDALLRAAFDTGFSQTPANRARLVAVFRLPDGTDCFRHALDHLNGARNRGGLLQEHVSAILAGTYVCANGQAAEEGRVTPPDDRQMRFTAEMPERDCSCVCGGQGIRMDGPESGFCRHCARGRHLALGADAWWHHRSARTTPKETCP